LMDASTIARRQNAGGGAGCCLNPKPPALLRNHARDNVRALREKERQMRGKAIMEAQAQPPELFKLKQFASAKPRVHDLKLKRQPSPANRAHSEPPHGRGASPTDENEEKEEEIDLATFEAEVEALKRKHGTGAPKQVAIKKDANGRPSYLRKIKSDIEKEQALVEQALARPDAPQGYRRLPPEEVAEVLAALKAEREEIEKEFRALPLKIETDAQKRREKAVKAKIEQSDKAIKQFSAPVVCVEA